MTPRLIVGLSGELKGQTRAIPCITLDSPKTSNLPFTLARLEFPLCLAFAMTINKSSLSNTSVSP
jgi:hypothetical protein